MASYEIKDGVGIIPESAKKIKNRGFKNCTDLTSVVIPKSVGSSDKCVGVYDYLS